MTSHASKAQLSAQDWHSTINDTSSLEVYEVSITAPKGYRLYDSGQHSLIVRMDRQKGSKKEKFWQKVHDILICGTFPDDFYEDWLAEDDDHKRYLAAQGI